MGVLIGMLCCASKVTVKKSKATDDAFFAIYSLFSLDPEIARCFKAHSFREMNILPGLSRSAKNKPFHDIRNILDAEEKAYSSDEESYDSMMIYQKEGSSNSLVSELSTSVKSQKWHLRKTNSKLVAGYHGPISSSGKSFSKQISNENMENQAIQAESDSRFFSNRSQSASKFNFSAHSLASLVSALPEENSPMSEMQSAAVHAEPSLDSYAGYVDFTVEDFVEDEDEVTRHHEDTYPVPLQCEETHTHTNADTNGHNEYYEEGQEQEDRDDEYIERVFSKTRHNRVDEVLSELAQGFGLDTRDQFGNTLLHICAQNNHVKLAKKIFQVYPHVGVSARNLKLLTPLDYAEKYKFDKMQALLVGLGAEHGVPKDQFRAQFR
ncbi:ankyrin repeat domain-containing protein [archaeon]|nr:MAG: ankyrin repeat domain-containing protein [archaeon]